MLKAKKTLVTWKINKRMKKKMKSYVLCHDKALKYPQPFPHQSFVIDLFSVKFDPILTSAFSSSCVSSYSKWGYKFNIFTYANSIKMVNKVESQRCILLVWITIDLWLIFKNFAQEYRFNIIKAEYAI